MSKLANLPVGLVAVTPALIAEIAGSVTVPTWLNVVGLPRSGLSCALAAGTTHNRPAAATIPVLEAMLSFHFPLGMNGSLPWRSRFNDAFCQFARGQAKESIGAQHALARALQ